ncbi:hypothetical protein BDZ89DRAFT_1143761 [Hymenopellis radicata]|nr:hypothetical protein BDZ89DRAFT_1143761 [Hymenopellis radicata]
MSADAKSEAAITAAFGIMDSIINNLTIDSGLREACESATELKCNADQQSFKGITVEYMAWFLAITSRDDGTKYNAFVKLQADKVLENAASPMRRECIATCGMGRMEAQRPSLAQRRVQLWVR